LSIVLVGLALYIQLKLEDTADFQAAQALAAKKHEDEAAALAAETGVSIAQARAKIRAAQGSPILKVLAKNPKEIFLAAGAFVAANGTFYLMITYAVAYATSTLHVARTTILWAVVLANVLAFPVLPLTAWLSDRIGRRSVFMAGALFATLWSAWPFFHLLDTASFPMMLLALIGGLAFNSTMYGCQAALMTELFSTEFRYSGASLGYQIGAICGGGFAPLIATALFAKYHTSSAIAVYMAALCIVSLISVFLLAETHSKAHRDAMAVS
jgi:MFS family permease